MPNIKGRLYLSLTFTTTVFSALTRMATTNCSPGITCIQIGLTGSIGMGKSTVATHFRQLGFPVFDADSAVHGLYRQGGKAVIPVGELFPDAIIDNAVSRAKLSEKVLGDASALKSLEKIVHPLVANERQLFFDDACSKGYLAVVYDIPLLLENRSNHTVDYVVVATASAETQQQRVMKRPGMTFEKFQSILSKQMPDSEKRKHADFLIHTDYPGMTQAKAQVAHIIESIISSRPDEWHAWKNRQQSTAATSATAATTNEEPNSIISRCFDAIVFDLDDTLVSAWPPVLNAVEEMYKYMDIHMPHTAPIARATLKSTIQQICIEQPLLAHDFTALRMEALRILSKPFNEEDKVMEAVQCFIRERSKVEPYLFEDTIPCLLALSKIPNIKLWILTNGNADLSQCPQLSQYISKCIHSEDVGAAKPSVVPFIAVTQQLGVIPSRILYVGDSIEHDVKGSVLTGINVAYIDRSESAVEMSSDDNISVAECTPDFTIKTLDILEIEAKVRAWAVTKGIV
eukprot:gene5827-11765_t